ncbi:hypothetical protein ABIB59_001350 [Citrobacter sp. UYEF32]
MSILSVMSIITVGVVTCLAARYAVYRFLVWWKPSKTLRLTYIDSNGVKHFREASLDAKNARDLASILNEIKRESKHQKDAQG